MKKNVILFLIPFLFLGINISNSFLLNKNQIKINQNDKIIDLSLGGFHSGMTVDTNENNYADTLYMWGYNDDGQLGDGTTNSSLSPIEITPQDAENWGGNIIDLSLGYYCSGVTIDINLDGEADTLYMWGYNNFGQIGDGTTNSSLSPIKITPQDAENWGGNIIDLSLGASHSGITVDTNYDGYADTLYMWGHNNDGQLGDGTTNNSFSPIKITPQNQSDWGGNIINLFLGNYDSGISIDTNLDGYADTLYMWGHNNDGQLGDGTTNNSLSPIKITPQNQSDWGGNIIDLSFGFSHSSISVDTNSDGKADTIYIWGDNDSGQLGDGSISNSLSPIEVTPRNQSDWGGDIIVLSAGNDDSGVIIDTDLDGYADTLYMWGHNNDGQIGDGTERDIFYPKIITPVDYNWNGNIINFSLGSYHSGVTIDTDYDGYGDTLYIWGNNDSGQLGDGTKDNSTYPELIVSSYSFFIDSFQYYYESNNNIEIDLKLNDYQNIINQNPELILIDQDNIQYTTTYIESQSNISDDQYHYQIDNILYGNIYQFVEISVDGNIFSLDQDSIMTDYLISDYLISSTTEKTATIDLILDQNSENFNIFDYSENERKIEINYTDIDKDVSNSQQFVLNQENEITLTNLNAETIYRIDSINYFYENNNYKYTVEQEIKIFQTSAAIPLINADSITLIENSLTTSSFQYTIEINNLKPNSNKDNFTQYDINNGIWLIDDSGNTYNSSFIDEKLISNGEINGTQNYQLTFLQEDLLSGQTYNFIGIGFNDPNGANPDTINFSSPFEVTTIIINKKFVDNSFNVNPESITTNSFEYTILIDDLILIDDTETEPIFSNFDLNENLYLKDQNDNIFPSSYVSNSAIKKGTGEEEGIVKYQFTFKVNNLNENTTYNFTNLSFTEDFNDSIDISANGKVTTTNNVSEKIIIWIIIIILILFILLILILLWIDLKMKKRTKEISDKLNNYDEL